MISSGTVQHDRSRWPDCQKWKKVNSQNEAASRVLKFQTSFLTSQAKKSS